MRLTHCFRRTLAGSVTLLMLLGALSRAPASDASASEGDSLVSKGAELLSEIRFLEARHKLALRQGINLALDIPAGTAVLEIEGIPVRAGLIRKGYLNRGAERDRRQAALRESLAAPFQLLNKMGNLTEDPPALDVSNIEILAEAARRGSVEPPHRSVSFCLLYERKLRIHVLSRSDGSLNSKWSCYWKKVGRRVEAWFHPGERWVILEMDAQDAVILYRTLPRGSGLALRL
ncbi:MAG: hypothetical protein KJ970_12290 [Candidatus Eisenbacteria bacterium]|uniref:DUF2092 domain-containing protein n=1 Tax=Eiseniibacteriota bacterium TaxID=2212470 RepID=A0A948RY40_UNCEI|nr:hypothetical protein [Candidatus Eisenbacteria bacterium]MBU1949805.1 hypothetical protein [Candidatus Eisenbacteria bacterium]MBU2691697.1 hypothetical protein [Candidatus Eisenbacteria bacterium]